LNISDNPINGTILQLKQGHRCAFRKIFVLYHLPLKRFIFSLTKSNHAAEDILQEVFVKVWSTRENIDCSKSFDSFIFTIARNLSLNQLRNLSNQRALRIELWRNLSFVSQETENQLLSEEYRAIVNDILENIPVRKRSIFILSKQQGKSNQEIADLLGISKKTVKNHLWKTLRTIRAQLKPHLTDVTLLIICSIASFF